MENNWFYDYEDIKINHIPITDGNTWAILMHIL